MAEAAALATAHLSRYDALLRVSETLAGHKTMAELFQVLAYHLHLVVPFDYLALILHDEPSHQMRLTVLEPADIVVPSEVASQPVAERGPAATVWETQKGIVIPIPETGPLQPPGLEFIRSQGRRMSCWLPLTTAHRKVGVLSFGSRSADAYTDDILAFMDQVAAVIAIAVDNGINFDQARRYQSELREERDNLRFLLDINNLLVSHLDYAALLEAISEAVQRVITHEHISLALYDENAGTLRLQWIYDEKRGSTAADLALPSDRSAAGVTFQRGVTRVFRRSDLEEFGPDGAPMMKAAGLESVCCVPLVTRNGKFGTLNVGSADADAFSEEDVTLLGQTSAQVAIAVENARAYQEMTRLNAQLADEKQYLERELHHEFSEIVGKSPALRGLLKAVKTVAPTDTTVLLLGETGTGKELIARAIHDHSPRRERTFVRMSVAALPPEFVRERAVWTRERRVHGRDSEPDRPTRTGAQGHAVPRRGGRHPGGGAAQVVTRLAGARVRAPWEHEDPAGRCAGRRCHEPRSGAHGRGWILQERPLLSPQCVSHQAAATERAGRGHFRAGETLRRKEREAPGTPGSIHFGYSNERAEGMGLAGQHPGVAERHRAGGHRVGWVTP